MATHTVRAALFFGLFAVLAMSLPTEASRVKAARLSSNWSSTRAHHTSATTTALTSISPIEYVNSLGGSLGGVALSGPYMYLVEGGGLTVLDVGSAPAPVQIARLPLPAIGHRVQVVGARAYVSARDGCISSTSATLPGQRSSAALPRQVIRARCRWPGRARM